MKRWTGALVAVLLACIPILFSWVRSDNLLQDSDTAYLLLKIREHHDPLRWFVGDWPLENHFYRPISTLFFEMDNALYGVHGAGYGLTNVLVAIGCVLGLFWLLRELTNHVVIATSATVLFAFWHVGWHWWFVLGAVILAALVGFIGLIRHRLAIRFWAPAALVLYYLSSEIAPLGSINAGVIAWLPGRTASVMALFMLLSLAAYARYERLTAVRIKHEPTPLDPPATKGTEVASSPAKAAWIWLVICVLSLALSLGSYEQAIMGPALLLAVAITMRCLGYRVHWALQGLFWSMLIGYLVLRQAVVPSDASKYQMQAFRTGPGVLQDIFTYAFPVLAMLPAFGAELSFGLVVLMIDKFWLMCLYAVSQVTAFYQARRHWQFAVAGWGVSVLAFLPMAFLKRFDHYHYLPMAFRSLFVVTLAWVAIDLAITAVSPRARQAPLRPSPAPGSLPRL